MHNIDYEKPVVIAGPTASGKSALAIALARAHDGVIINADALQVYDCWRVLTARPGPEETREIPHFLYGHVNRRTAYSVGQWLREVAEILSQVKGRMPIIVGGTGLYLSALLHGLAEIPAIPVDVRRQSELLLSTAEGRARMLAELHDNDLKTWGKIDQNNPVRVQRAWEVLRATGRSLSDWQEDPTLALLPRGSVNAICLDAPKDWLTPRIKRRFQAMVENGALDEVRAALPDWNPSLPSSRAIGAAELMSHLRGELPLATAIERAVIATRQYAKRQRSWFRSRMGDWTHIDLSTKPCE